MKVLFYSHSGKLPVLEFIQKQPVKDKAKILACLKSLEELGLDSPRVGKRQIKRRLWELKIRTAGGGYRIFYVLLTRGSMVLLHVYKKQSQKAPVREIAVAEKRLEEVLCDEESYID